MRYSLQSTERATRPQVIADKDFIQALRESDSRFVSVTQTAKQRGSLAITEQDNDLEFTFRFERALRKHTPEAMRSTYTSAYLAFEAIANFAAYSSDDDPLLRLSFSHQKLSDDSRLGMDATLSWPKVSTDAELTAFTTYHMQRVARQIGYPKYATSRRELNEFVGVNIHREHGVELTALPGSLSTDGGEYLPSTASIEMYGHNIYTTEMQLICAVGAIAFAHYDDLTSPNM